MKLKPNIINNNIVNNNNTINNVNNTNIGITMNLHLQMPNINIIENINQKNQNQNLFEINPNLNYFQNNLMFHVNNYPMQSIGINSNFGNIDHIQNHQQNVFKPINMLINQNMSNLNNINNNINSNISFIKNMNNNIRILNNNKNIFETLNNVNNLNNSFLSQNNQLMNNPSFSPNYFNNNMMNIKNNHFNNNLIEEKNPGKYTCKYEILLENEPEFQIARRLIGSKGCNMKKIINQCKSKKDGESVKLRLRGKGSGYKEGPDNKESDEPLHLCISCKNSEEMKKACGLVDELLKNIYEDYKDFCKTRNILPIITEIATRIESKNINYKLK
jgi:hypothetical protein